MSRAEDGSGLPGLPAFIRPMLAETAPYPPSGPQWEFEVKWDGFRCLAFVSDHTRLQSRSGRDLTPRVPELGDLSRILPAPARPLVLDGELVAFSAGTGQPDFSLLSRRMAGCGRRSATVSQSAAPPAAPLAFVAFDLLYLAGRSLMQEPLQNRRQLLGDLLSQVQTGEVSAGALAYSPSLPGSGPELAAAVFERGLEGLMAKDQGSPYLPGMRSRHWLKVKKPEEQRLYIGGYWERGSEAVSLLVGSKQPGAGELQLWGAVGSGISAAEGRRLDTLLRPLETESCLFQGGAGHVLNALCHGWPAHPSEADAQPGRTLRWVRPLLSCRVAFLERTESGLLRHPVYRGGLARQEP